MAAIDYEQARFNMIEQQIRPWEVLDQRVLDVLATVPRENFVPQRYQHLAFADVRIPIGHDQVMMNPNIEGRLLQALAIKPNDKILEIGTGSGYLTACLARLGTTVTSIDLYADFIQQARTKLKQHGFSNIRLQQVDVSSGWQNENQYDAIAITSAVPKVNDIWRHALALGGRLFVISGSSPAMQALLITRTHTQEWLTQHLFETDVPYLVNNQPTAEFEF